MSLKLMIPQHFFWSTFCFRKQIWSSKYCEVLDNSVARGSWVYITMTAIDVSTVSEQGTKDMKWHPAELMLDPSLRCPSRIEKTPLSETQRRQEMLIMHRWTWRSWHRVPSTTLLLTSETTLGTNLSTKTSRSCKQDAVYGSQYIVVTECTLATYFLLRL